MTLPSSKSISNRLLILDFLANCKWKLHNLSTADDTVIMRQLLHIMEEHKNSNDYITLNCKNAGTVYRFLIALCSITNGKWMITGDARLKQRPIKPLIDTLKQMGADISINENNDILISAKKLNGTEPIIVSAEMSSQFTSALMMIAPAIEGGLKFVFNNRPKSFPYIRMTEKLLEKVIHQPKHTLTTIFSIEKQREIHIEGTLKPTFNYYVESDWTAASYLYAALLLSSKKEIKIKHLIRSGLQGDEVIIDLFEQMGIQTEFQFEKTEKFPECECTISKINNKNIANKYMAKKLFQCNFSDNPDLAQTFAVLCFALNINANLKGLSTLKYKETDRLTALYNELKKIGANVEITDETLIITRLEKLPEWFTNHTEISINTYNDHRMAMAFSLLKFINPNIQIENPSVVQKSFPNFWNEIDFFTNEDITP